jgi:chromosome segregation ATPase
MPRTGVSYDDVAESIHSLEKAGLKPSIRLIREKLGKGSLSTIAEHKRAYDIEASQGPTEALPDPIAKGLLKGAEGFWQELVDAAQDEIDAAQSQADALVAKFQAHESALENELAGAKDENGTLVAELAERDQYVTALDGKLAEATASLQSAEKEAMRLQEQRDAATARSDDKEHQLNSLREDLQVIRKEREALDLHLERQATDHVRELAMVIEKLAEEKTARKATVLELEKVRAAAEKDRNMLNSASRRILALEEDASKLEKALSLATKTLTTHVAQEKQSATENAKLMAESVAAKDANAAMIKEKDARIADLSTSLQALSIRDQAEKRRSRRGEKSTKQ